MTANAKPKAKGRKKPEVPALLSYVLEIEDWNWDYSFGVDELKHEGPYREFRHLSLFGRLLQPEALYIEHSEFTFMPNPGHDFCHRESHQPKTVGHIHLYQKTLRATAWMPQDALPPVLTMLAAKQLRYANLTGEKLRYRKAPILSYRLQRRWDVDE